MNISEPNENDNANESKARKLPAYIVDREAMRLAKEYANPDFKPFYCKAIYSLGLERITELEGRVSDAKFPGKLLTKLLKEDMDRFGKKSIPKLEDFRKNYGG